MRRAWSLLAAGMTVALLAPGAGRAQQSLAQRIAQVQGEAELRFASRPGVCGNGEGSISFRSPSESISSGIQGRGGWEYDCEPGPVRVRLTVSNGTVTKLRSYVGRSRDTAAGITDLGAVGAREAADYFLGLARTGNEDVARKAITPVALADSVTVWPKLIELARDRDRPIGVRKPALFWDGQGDSPTANLLVLYHQLPEPELKRQMIFVLSQRDDSAAVDGLIDIARSDPDHAMRKRAFFWLGQKDDPRVVQLLTSILEK
jgi:hypothetical protein